MIIGGIVGQQHLGGAGDLRRRLGDRPARGARHQDVHIAARRFRDLRCGGHRVEGRGLQCPVVVFGDDENRHQITRASSLSLSTSSATEPTLTPPCRFAGSSTFKVTSRGVTSTPSCSGVMISIGFFLAFMMLGSEA